ncbi:MAG: GNAT family N-acetyltransferase [Lachnospiraceae bacterium]|nr:GNAT family N-acetyltransferase [Lachnospiraceae bacterium]
MFNVTYDKDSLVRLEDEVGSAVTIQYENEIGHIISINVPREEREKGRGEALLDATEQLAYNYGLKILESDYIVEHSALNALFKKRNFELDEGVPVLAVNLENLLKSKAVKKTLRNQLPDLEFITLEEMFMSQYDVMIEILRRFDIRLDSVDMNNLVQNISGVVFDRDKKLKSLVLCSESGFDLHVDILFGVMKNGPQYVLAALQGMLLNLVRNGGAENYTNLSMIAANKFTETLLVRVLDKDYEIEKRGSSMHARKELTGENGLEISSDAFGDKQYDWHDELEEYPLQGNAGWKIAWQREREQNI